MSAPTAERPAQLDVSPELVARYRALKARKAEIDAALAARYRRDPVAWVRDVLKEDVWSLQGEIMAAVAEHPMVAVQSCHGLGKTHLASRLIGWFVATHDVANTMVVTTAPTAHQVRAVLWRYVRQTHELAGLSGHISQAQVPEWKIDGQLVGFGRRPADHQQSSFQGQHAEHMLIVFDEAGGIPKWLWDAADSMMTGDDQHMLAIGNPDDNSSHFHTVCTTETGWHRFQVSAFDTPNLTGEPVSPEMAARLVQRSWVTDKQVRWGEASPLYQAKVLGEFVDSEDGLIPLSWVKAAHARWHAWRDAGSREVGGRRIIGVDVARYGTDATCLAIREGDVIRELVYHSKLDTVEVATLVEAQLAFPASQAVVDVIGVGAGVVDLLRHRRQSVVAFNAAMRTGRRDTTGSWKFPNVRSASYWNLRELLDPSAGATLALPDDDDLTADLITPTWRIGTGNTVIVESKDEIRKRLGRSTDAGDAVAMAMWHSPSTGRSPDERPRRRGAVAYADGVTWR